MSIVNIIIGLIVFISIISVLSTILAIRSVNLSAKEAFNLIIDGKDEQTKVNTSKTEIIQKGGITIMEIKIKKLYKDSILPTRGSEYAAGYDLYAHLDSAQIIAPHDTVKIGTGVAIQPPKGCFGAVFARSGLAAKEGLRPANAVGVCDEDYTGEYIIALHNDSTKARTIEPGERIGQVVFIPYTSVTLKEVDKLDETERGDGGFGSTGK